MGISLLIMHKLPTLERLMHTLMERSLADWGDGEDLIDTKY